MKTPPRSPATRLTASLLCAASLAVLAATAHAADPIKSIGMAVGDLGNPFYVAQRKAAEEAARRIDPAIMVTTVAHTYDLKKQIDLIDNLISAKTDVLLLESAGDNTSLRAVIGRAHAAGITVIGMHSDIAGADASVMTDNVMAGEEACRFIAEKLNGKGNLVIINGPPVPSVTERVDGCHHVLDAQSGINILSENQDGKASRDGGMQVMQALLVANPTINAVFTINDPTAAGAELALRQARRNDIFIVSVDGAPDAIRALKNPKSFIVGTAPQDPYKITDVAIETALAIRHGQAPAERIIRIPAPIVTRDNVNDYLGWDR